MCVSVCVFSFCRDVSSVEVLMNYHQSLKNEVEARSHSIFDCIEMGKMLLAARNPAAEEVTSGNGMNLNHDMNLI